ncbi:uncharacterized protein LOC115467020 [Microcaecilia unicolor]|uniref:Uncharacterized protein LOC115467020 n=1 Tax=Microcaecilia unicolor TaxID=1415580 RepID=A0A6P7XG71_9AMPH|nr:uncharacterized protein LOC115467020 [Microcaecilia unicolor]
MEGRKTVKNSGREGQMGNSPLEKSVRFTRHTQEWSGQPQYGGVESRNLEGSSRVPPDTIQELKELITEIEKSVDPLALDFINILTQQVKICVKLLSKTKQQPLENEQVRIQNYQKEANAVLEKGDGHKGKCQIPQDALVSHGKRCSSQGQGVQPCLQSSVCNVQVLVTGKTFGSEQQFLNQVEQHLCGLGTQFQKEDYTHTSDKLLLLFCPVASQSNTDIDNALENIPSQRKTILIVMHFTPNQSLSLYTNSSWIQHGSLINTVDCRFSESSGLYDCSMNTKAIISVASTIQQARQSRENMHGDIEDKNLEGCSQKQSDTVQKIGNNTEKLISEMKHLKTCLDPLAPDLINTVTQQVRIYMKLLSKTNQQPLESEQVRKQHHQREESFPEAKAVPEEGAGHKGKCRLPLDASPSCGKSCRSQGRGIPSCLQSTVCNVQVLVTGQTFGSDHQFLNQVEERLCELGTQLQKDDYTSTSNKLLLLFCPVTLHRSTTINCWLDKISNQRKVILVVMHCVPIQNLWYGTSTQIQHGCLINAVDCYFSEAYGLHSCTMNTKAIISVASKIKQHAEQSRENMHREIDKKNLEGHSQKQIDTVQEIGNKTEELISETEHLKTCLHPLALDLIDTLMQQVRMSVKLLSKTNQQPLESEQVRKHHQREESFPEAKVVPEEGDGYKGKCQIPLDASVSQAKSCRSQSQEIQPYLQREVCNVQVLVTGQTFGSEQRFLNQVEQHLHRLGTWFQKEDYTPTSDKLLLLFCPVTSRHGTDINNALENIPGQRKVILVVMHFSPNQNVPLYLNSSQVQHASLINTVDCRFSEGCGLYSCRMNTEAITSVASDILQCQSSLRDNI